MAFCDANAAFGAAAAVAAAFGAARYGRNAGAGGAIGSTSPDEAKRHALAMGNDMK